MSTLSENATHITNIKGKLYRTSAYPSNPEIGDMIYDTDTNTVMRWTGDNWMGAVLTTTSTSTSTSTSTTTTA